MTYNTVHLTNEQEKVIVAYCAKHDIEFKIATANDVTMEAFKNDPIMQIEKDKVTGEESEHNVTARIARYIECQKSVVERIAEKIELEKTLQRRIMRKKNIQKAKMDTNPDLEKLVDNLYQLNIVDEHSYLALVCFLMQLKYSRDNEIAENGKTCVFFNGVARNGKSATAKAICDIEAQYGEVFKAQSGKILESTHEEQVWQSHLNYFDEVKPTDIDRELLLTIVNGGNVELNPKNKKPYNYHVNTNNIFASNDQISLKQRRVSVIKFGNRLNGRPLAPDTLKTIIINIMNSLPNFDRYYDLYDVVSTYNENRITPLAVNDLLTFINDRIGFVNESNELSVQASLRFAPHDIFSHIKGAYNKQAITSERKGAIILLLEHLVEKKLIDEVKYKNCSTRNFYISGDNFIKITAEFDKINTAKETNIKILKVTLLDALTPYFQNKPIVKMPSPTNKTKPEEVCIPIFDRDSTVYKALENDVCNWKLKTHNKSENEVSEFLYKKGTVIYYKTILQIQGFKWHYEDIENDEQKKQLYYKLITPDFCRYVRLETLINILKEELQERFKDEEMVTQIYMQKTGLTDKTTFLLAEKEKYSENSYVVDGVSVPVWR